MTNLSFQSQDCKITLAEGLEEYRAYLQANGKKQLVDEPGSTIIRDHDATHVIFGLDTSIEQESMLDSWVITCLLYTSPSPRDLSTSRMPSSA